MFYESINSLAYDSKNGLVFAGTRYGKILILDHKTFDVKGEFTAQPGMIDAIALRADRQLIACMGGARAVFLGEYDPSSYTITAKMQKNIREAGVDDADPIHSTSQAIDIHPTEDRLITRSGNACVVELDFKGNIVSAARPGYFDIITTKYADCGTYALFGSNLGCIGIYANGTVETMVTPNTVTETFHWFEQVSENQFIAACDQRFLVRVTVNKSDVYGLTCQFGEVFTKDDLEHVTVSPSGRVLASSFDRNVYEIDPQTLNPIKVAFDAPFKTRWVKFEAGSSHIAMVQVRDGSIIRFDCDTGKTLTTFKHTPPAMWSSCEIDNKLVGAGEDGFIFQVNLNPDRATVTGYAQVLQRLELSGGYFKRLEPGAGGDALAGSTCGRAYLINGADKLDSIELGAPVRDIAFHEPTNSFYVALESGQVMQYANGQLREVYVASQPVWSLAVSPDGNILAFGERHGNIYLMALPAHQIVETLKGRLPKRMKWLNDTTLVVTNSSCLDKIHKTEGAWVREEEFIDSNSNTVEDFIFLNQYLVSITYSNRAFLSDLETGSILDSSYYGAEHAKSISLSSSGVISIMGRSGTVKNYILHSEQLLPVGEINTNLNEPEKP